MRKRLSDKEKMAILAAYKENPNVVAVANTCGCSRDSVYRVLAKNNIPTLSNDSVADSIIRRMEKNPEMFSKNFEQLSAVLGSSNVVGVLRHPEKYRETVGEQARTALLLALSALITQDKLSLASPSAIAQVVPVLAEIASGKYNLGSNKPDNLNPENIIESIQIQLKRIRTFDPKLAKDTEETVQGFINLPVSAVKEVKKKEGG